MNTALTWPEAVTIVGVSWALAWAATHLNGARRPMTPQDVFAAALAAGPDRKTALLSAIAQLCAAESPPITRVEELVSQCWAMSDDMPPRQWPKWAASQWVNYVHEYAQWTADRPLTFEEFVGGRVLDKDAPATVASGPESYRFIYPGGHIIDVSGPGVFVMTINGRVQMGQNLEAMEIDLFRSIIAAAQPDGTKQGGSGWA